MKKRQRNQENIKVWAFYLRCSDRDKQTPEDSFEMQRQSIHENLISKSDIPMGREYKDILTGRKYDRKEFIQLIEDARNHKFSHLALYRVDRFGRNAYEGEQIAQELINLGINIRIAQYPTLMPETSDGYMVFKFLLTIAQHEVDILEERTHDGVKRKLSQGGWPFRAPEGYANKEIQVSSNKYFRWVEKDPEYIVPIQFAWRLLLTGKYTLESICLELTRLGYMRSTGLPWSWTDLETGEAKTSSSMLFKVFHNAFYIGWASSDAYEIGVGSVKGDWEPAITVEEFDRGIEILHQHDENRVRLRRHIYLLKGILWMEFEGKLYKVYNTTPAGRDSKPYPYYLPHVKLNGQPTNIPCSRIDQQVNSWIYKLEVGPSNISLLRSTYKEHLLKTGQAQRSNLRQKIENKVKKVQQEEHRMARLYASGNLTDETYSVLHNEWLKKLKNAEQELIDFNQNPVVKIDNLEAALKLVSVIGDLFQRLGDKEQWRVMQLIANRVVVDEQGTIKRFEALAPFELSETSEYSTKKPPFPELTDREREILAFLVQGHTNPEIADLLMLSQKTIRNLVSLIYTKLEAKNRAQAILKAKSAGMR